MLFTDAFLRALVVSTLGMLVAGNAVKSSGRQLSTPGTIAGCYLVNLGTNQEIDLATNDSYNPSVNNTAGWSMYCKTESPGKVDYVKFFYDTKVSTQYFSPERYANSWLQPFWMEGDNSGTSVNDVSYLDTPGFKTVHVKFYTWHLGDNAPIDEKTHVFSAVPLPAPTGQSIYDILVATPTFSTLKQAVVNAGLVNELEGPGPFTVFAPTNAAFAALPQQPIANLLNSPVALQYLLLGHAVQGEFPKSMLEDISPSVLAAFGCSDLGATTDGSSVKVNTHATISHHDNYASNGVIHTIDDVLCTNGGFTCPTSSSSSIFCPRTFADC